jgi:hypothetical protein
MAVARSRCDLRFGPLVLAVALGVTRRHTDEVFIFGWPGAGLIVIVTLVGLVARVTGVLRYARP